MPLVTVTVVLDGEPKILSPEHLMELRNQFLRYPLDTIIEKNKGYAVFRLSLDKTQDPLVALKQAIQLLPDDYSLKAFELSADFEQYWTISEPEARALLRSSLNALDRHGCKTFGTVRKLTTSRILAMRNVGKKRAQFISDLFDIK